MLWRLYKNDRRNSQVCKNTAGKFEWAIHEFGVDAGRTCRD